MEQNLSETIHLEDLNSIAADHSLTHTETLFFVDLISTCFPLCHSSYAITWAKRIQRRSEYHCASGNVRYFLDNSLTYSRVKKERLYA